MKNTFSIKTNAKVRPNNILITSHKSATFGDKNLTWRVNGSLSSEKGQHKAKFLIKANQLFELFV